MNAAVVTGLGVVGAFGSGRAPLAAALRAGRAPAREIDRSEGFHLPDAARCAGLLPPDATAEHVPPAAARRMSPPSRSAVAAARMALADAGLEAADVAGPRTAVCLATSFGSTSTTVRLLRQMHDSGPEAVSPFHFMESVANAHAGQVALALRAEGPNHTLTQREAGALLAVARGRELLRAGACDLALVGVVDEMAPMAHAVLDRFGALARPTEPGGPEVARPFDAGRNGFLAAEGAAVWVLEGEERAAARGARVLGRVRCAVRAFDPTAGRSGWGRGEERLAADLAPRLAAAGVAPGDFDRVVSGASGSRGGDRVEAGLLRALWGAAELPPVLAPKGVTGEYGGGFLAAALLAVEPGAEPSGPTGGFERYDPRLGVSPWAAGLLGPGRRALVSSLAAGGAAAWLVLEAP